MKKPTFAVARNAIFSVLGQNGWQLSDPILKVPHATAPDGSIRLWFKPQAVWMGESTKLGDAHSLFVDIRDLSTDQFIAYIARVMTKL